MEQRCGREGGRNGCESGIGRSSFCRNVFIDGQTVQTVDSHSREASGLLVSYLCSASATSSATSIERTKICLSGFAQYRRSVPTIDVENMTEAVGIRQKLDVTVPLL